MGNLKHKPIEIQSLIHYIPDEDDDILCVARTFRSDVLSKWTALSSVTMAMTDSSSLIAYRVVSKGYVFCHMGGSTSTSIGFMTEEANTMSLARSIMIEHLHTLP
jgi:hypothetical protein